MRLWYPLLAALLPACILLPARGQPANLEVAFPSLTFNQAVDLQHAGDGTGRLFAVVLGRIVATLVDERQRRGPHEVRFDARDVPDGLYFYRMQARSFVQTRSLIVLQ